MQKCRAVPHRSLPPCGAGLSHMEKSRVQQAAASGRGRTHAPTVRASIPVCSRSDSLARHGYTCVPPAEATDVAREFPYAIPLPHKGGGNHVARTFAPRTICPAPRCVHALARKRGPRGRELGQRTGSPLPRGRTEVGAIQVQLISLSVLRDDCVPDQKSAFVARGIGNRPWLK